jgi:hypothetical protein
MRPSTIVTVAALLATFVAGAPPAHSEIPTARIKDFPYCYCVSPFNCPCTGPFADPWGRPCEQLHPFPLPPYRPCPPAERHLIGFPNIGQQEKV